MSLLLAVVDQVASVGGLVKGSTLFAGRLPEQPDAAVLVYEYEGQPAKYTMGNAGNVLDRPRIQVMVRAARDGYATGHALAETLHRGLDVAEVTWGGYRIHRCQPVSTLSSIGVDDADRPMFTVRFEIMTTRA